MERADELAADVDALVAAMVATTWPTTPSEYPQWAARVGLPVRGQLDSEMNEHNSASTHFISPDHPWRLSWHYFHDEFVGVSLFPGNSLRSDVRLCFARRLCDRFDARWDAVERIDAAPPLTGFTSYWLPGPCMVDLYWHAPQVLPAGHVAEGSIQLAITHHARAQAEDDAYGGEA